MSKEGVKSLSFALGKLKNLKYLNLDLSQEFRGFSFEEKAESLC